ncbi:MAG TPA: serine hydrolase [Candidatus Cybelea sp.]|jgi:CubicO group peptidase (beta-lactamase class C family)|nr:serine hydrolase [Candidatus Cybelea sp.]
MCRLSPLVRTLSLAALASLCQIAPGAAATAPTVGDALDAISAFAPRAMAEQGTPGLSVAITDRNGTLRVIALGYADRESQAPVTPQTRFAIGSITKSMTALALLQLVDAGRVDLDAPVQRYLPWFAIRAMGPILVHELLSHTAGIPDDFAAEPGYVYDIWTLRNAQTLFPPATAWSYSNDGFATAGAILAKVDGRTWPDSLQSRVLTPIGMTASSPVFTPQNMGNAAVGYQFRDNDRPPPRSPALVAAPPLDFVDPAGSVLSTPEDMARYMRFYLNSGKTADGVRLLSPATFAAMTRADRYKNGKPAGSAGAVLDEAPAFYRQYGYGVSVFDENGDHLVGHTGGISGYTACMQMNLTRGFGVIAFANLVEAPLHPCAIVLYAMRALRAQSLGQPLPAPPSPPDPGRVARAAEYQGVYSGPSGSSLRVTNENDRLYLTDGSRRGQLYSRAPDVFWADDPRFAIYLLAFGRDAAGKVVEMNYGPQWYANERYRGPRTFTHPAKWDALVGRYENTFFGSPDISRVVIVKSRLTFDGLDTLRPLPNGNFALGSSVVRFDAYAGGRPQRVTIDAASLYRVELP